MDRITVSESGVFPLPSNEVDVEIGRRLAQLLDTKQVDKALFAQDLSIALEQLEAHETGSQRMGTQLLYKIATTLDVEISYFFERLGPDNMQTMCVTEEERRFLTLLRAMPRTGYEMLFSAAATGTDDFVELAKAMKQPWYDSLEAKKREP